MSRSAKQPSTRPIRTGNELFDRLAIAITTLAARPRVICLPSGRPRPGNTRRTTTPHRQAVQLSTRAIVGEFLDRLGAGDADGVGKLFSDRIDWFVPGNSRLPWTGRRTRGDEVSEYLQTMWPHFLPGASKVEVHSVIVDGDDAVVLSTFEHTVKSNGRTFMTPSAMHLKVTDGKITEMELYEDTAAVSQAFFPDESGEVS
jgi:ketosteroid isomerase-like protein